MRERKPPDRAPFGLFIEQVLESFGYLTGELGFEHYKTEIVSYECSVAFRKNDVVAVHVVCEMGALPWVMLFGRTGKRVEEGALDFVIQHRCPERQPDVEYEYPASEEGVRRLVREYAALLRACAADFLEGDPSVLEAVRPLVDAAHRRRLRQAAAEARHASARAEDGTGSREGGSSA